MGRGWQSSLATQYREGSLTYGLRETMEVESEPSLTLESAQRRKLTKDSELAHSALLSKVPKLTKFFTIAEGTTQQPTSSLLASSNTQDFDHECEQDLILTEVEETAEILKEETSDKLKKGTVEMLNYQNKNFSNDTSTWSENLTVRKRDEIITRDVSHKEQTSLTIRYVHEEEEIDGEIVIEESFIGYTITEESTGEALTQLLTEEVELCGLDMSNCRGQTWQELKKGSNHEYPQNIL
ncbi:hypothetical protein J6590_044769 [Homalodisca vitripennis]|nr:hypothetical protein J6590_044769 [Homalodisca vitripennis]